MTLVSTLTLDVAICGYYWVAVGKVHEAVGNNASRVATQAARAIAEIIEKGDRPTDEFLRTSFNDNDNILAGSLASISTARKRIREIEAELAD